MTNEAICIETPTKFARYTVAAGTTIPFGTILKLTDPNTAIASSASNDPFAGIAWVVKDENDTSTEIVAALDGVWDLKATTATINIGIPVSVGGANLIRSTIEADLPLGTILGKALEAASNDEVIRVRVGDKA